MLVSRAAPLRQKISIGIKFLNSIRIAILADIKTAFLIANGIGDKGKFARRMASDSPNLLVPAKITAERVGERAIIMGVGDQQVWDGVGAWWRFDSQSGGPSVFGVRCFPTSLEIPIDVKNLDPPGGIDNK